MQKTKRCTRCGETKPIDQFGIRIDRKGHPRQSHCYKCHNELNRMYASRNKKSWKTRPKPQSSEFSWGPFRCF